MSKTPWTPWHEVVKLRDDLKSGELSLSMFAADLYDVAMGRGKPVYQEPGEFFALTYPTFNLRELAKGVATRLAGQSDKAVRQLVLTYGGGKTHALITLFHLANRPKELPELPALQEFIEHIGFRPPAARVAVLAFDKLDEKMGTDSRAPDGSVARFRYPWTVLAYQLGGKEGLRILGHGEKERETPPAQNVLEDLLRLPAAEDLATLVLIDEVLMWARTMAGAYPVWRERLQDFFQCLTQAATKVERCAIVASLLATEPRKSDALGKEITNELYSIFRREQEEPVEPVVKEDVAEVLRRRFFTPESIRDRNAFRPHVVAALQGIADLDERTEKEGAAAEERFLNSYPFHPDLTEVLYGKWTALEGFQQTRGVLRTFAMALREAERWDSSPLVGVNVFLDAPEKPGLGEAARELAHVAATEEYDGKRQAWSAILDGEFERARAAQEEFPSLRHRELEQSVFATFLHSQPIGQKALTRELMVLLGATRPDRIDLEKALARWADTSWFLDDAAIAEAEERPDGTRALPKSWRLGSKPNLKQMHHDACLRVSPEFVEQQLVEAIRGLKLLTAGAAGAGARVHNLPERPRDVEDDGEFHYAVLPPRAACEAGRPGPEAKRFLAETTGPDRPRVFRNSLLLAVPSRDGLELARTRVRDHLGWVEVGSQLAGQPIDPLREAKLKLDLETAARRIPEAILQAYCLVVTVSAANEVEALRLTVTSDPLFQQIKADPRARIQETAVTADALLPDGPYNLWREGETSRRVKDLVGAFAQFPQLPKMLNRQAIMDTLVQGCLAGAFVLQLSRPDRSVRTFWRQAPDEVALKEPGLEAFLPEAATLVEIAPSLLRPGELPGLWSADEIAVQAVYDYFAGGHQARVEREAFEDFVTIPRAEASVVDAAIHAAVRHGVLWLTNPPASFWVEQVPEGILTEGAILQAPPASISPAEVVAAAFPEGSGSETATALAVATALSQKAGKTLPWSAVRRGIDAALQSRFVELGPGSPAWPVEFAGAQSVALRIPDTPAPAPLQDPWPGVHEGAELVAKAELQAHQIQDLVDALPELKQAAVGLDLKFELLLRLAKMPEPTPEQVEAINQVLANVSAELKLEGGIDGA